MDAHTELSIADAIVKLEYLRKHKEMLVREDQWNMVREAIRYLKVAETDLKPRNK
jgi:hypothetical protein